MTTLYYKVSLILLFLQNSQRSSNSLNGIVDFRKNSLWYKFPFDNKTGLLRLMVKHWIGDKPMAAKTFLHHTVSICNNEFKLVIDVSMSVYVFSQKKHFQVVMHSHYRGFIQSFVERGITMRRAKNRKCVCCHMFFSVESNVIIYGHTKLDVFIVDCYVHQIYLSSREVKSIVMV